MPEAWRKLRKFEGNKREEMIGHAIIFGEQLHVKPIDFKWSGPKRIQDFSHSCHQYG